MIGAKFVVFPASDGLASLHAPERISLHLGPGRAFGSGGHETTASCLEEMEEVRLKASSKVLDLGCGTGILAIAAAKLGAREILAVDPDAEAVDTTLKNARLNGVEGSVTVVHADVSAAVGRRFELILANIYGDVLISLAGDIVLLLGPGGTLILSGVHYDYAYDVKRAYANFGLNLSKARALENFCTFVFAR